MNNSISIVVAILVVVCGVVLLLPVVLVEPDDFDWYGGMLSFSRGQFISSEEEVREIHEEMAERFGGFRFRHGELRFPMVRTGRGLVHERSPGYYAFLALFHLLGLDRYTNVFLAVAGVLFFFLMLRKFADERLALCATLLMIFNATFLTGLYRVYMSDFSYFIFGLFAMGVYWLAREKGNASLYGLAGFLLSVSVIFRITNAIFFVSIAIYELCILTFPKAFSGSGNASAAPSLFSARRIVPLVIGLLAGISPLLLYNLHTMDEIFGTGYSQRFSHEGWKYFSFFGRRAIFSVRNIGYTFPVGLPRLLQGYPIALLAPAGFLLLGMRRTMASGLMQDAGAHEAVRQSPSATRRLALFAGLWFGTYWAFYLCFSTIREDSFQFMCRKFLPSLPAVCIGAAAVLQAAKGKWKTIALATVAIFGIAVTSEFVVRFVVPQPFGQAVLPPREPPPEAFREVADRLGEVEELLPRDAEEAMRPLHRSVVVLKDISQAIPGPVGRELDEASGDLRELENQLNRSAREGEKLSGEALAESRSLLERIRSRMDELALSAPGQPPFGPGGPRGIPAEVIRRVELLHRLIDEAQRDGADAAIAIFLDEVARIKIEERRFGEAIELLDEAIASLGGIPGSGAMRRDAFRSPRFFRGSLLSPRTSRAPEPCPPVVRPALPPRAVAKIAAFIDTDCAFPIYFYGRLVG